MPVSSARQICRPIVPRPKTPARITAAVVTAASAASLAILLAVLRRRDLQVLLEDAVEMTLVVEAAPDSDLRKWLTRMCQSIGSAGHTQMSHVVADGVRIHETKCLCEMNRMDGCDLSELVQRQPLMEIRV